MSAVAPVPVAGLVDALAEGLAPGSDGRPSPATVVVDLDTAATPGQCADAAAAAHTAGCVVIGVATAPPPPPYRALGEALSCSLVGGRARAPWQVAVADPGREAAALASAVAAAPVAAATLVQLLRLTADAPVREGLVAESLAYSTLLAGAEFRRWCAARPPAPGALPSSHPVLLEREGARLSVVLNRPERRNAFSRQLRDGLVEALDLVHADPTIEEVTVHGAGRSFCSGGDLDEFGTSTDPATAHLVRVARSVAARMHACRDRVRVVLHGACIGAGIELPSFAGHVAARSDTWIRLPELGMGLVPGAGGTVGITRRVGRWRTAYLALSGAPIDVDTALAWGLVDARA